MSDLVENGVVSQQPTQGTTLDGPQQHQLRQQQQTKSTSSPNQQGLLTTGQVNSNVNTHPSAGSMSNLSNSDDDHPEAEHNMSYNKQHQGIGQLRNNDQMQRQRNPNISRQHHYSQHEHYNSKHNINNNNNNQMIDSKDDIESNVNHVLLITVINPHYPITCDVIHLICSNYGKVNRIVIFKKNGVQAMVEFDDVASARRARSFLHGCDIYSGCCTLRVEYAKPTRLNIHKNDNESFDYTLGIGGGGDEHDQHPAHHDHAKGDHPKKPNKRAIGGDSNSSAGASGLDHHQQQPHHSGHYHPKHHQQSSSVSPNTSDQHHHAQMYGVAANQSGSIDPEFQASQEGFNGPRSGGQIHATGSSVANSGQPEPSDSYIGVNPFALNPANHGSHIMHQFPRHDSQDHHHHHPHHNHHQSHRIGGDSRQSSSLGHHHGRHAHSHHHSSYPSHDAALMTGPTGMTTRGTVMMVYGLNIDRINCDRLFNLFCLYGNVVRIKFLRTKDGCAMVQMGDALAVNRCLNSLNKVTLFGNELQISYSKQAFLHDVIQPFILPDGSPSFKDFMGNKNNRFKNPEVASKNRILPPSQVLHFFNAPFGITEDELAHLFKQTTDHEPVSMKIFTPKTENSKSNSGLVTFRDPVEATEALVLCNHLSMSKADAPHPYILRLCFSPPTYARHSQQPHSQQANQEGENPNSGVQLSNLSGLTSTEAGSPTNS